MSRKWECTMFSGLAPQGFISYSLSNHIFFMFLRKYPIYGCMKISHIHLSWLLLPRSSGTCIDFQFSSASSSNVHCCRKWILVFRVEKLSWRPSPRRGAAAGRTPRWASWCERACCGDTHSDFSPGGNWDWTEESKGGEKQQTKKTLVCGQFSHHALWWSFFTFLILRYSCTIWLWTVWKSEKTEQNRKK